MRIKKDGIHLQRRKTDSYNKPFNFYITERETGKSTDWQTKVYNAYKHHHRPSILIRRQIADITEVWINDVCTGINNFIADKYKEKSLTLDKLMAHYDKLILKKNINFQRKTHFLNQELFLDNNSGDNMNPKNNKSEVNQMNNYWGQPNQMMEMEIKKEKLSKNAKRFAKSKSKFKSREIKEMDDDHNF